LKNMNASVDLRIYPGMGHTINADEMEVAKQILGQSASTSSARE
jgi:predicted esterase